MSNKIFNLSIVLKEIFSTVNILEDESIFVENKIEFIHVFDDLTDPRQSWKTEYKLSNILLLCFLSIIYEGKTSCLGIYDHILVYQNRYEQLGLIENGKIPSHDTIRRTLMSIDPIEFENITIGRIHDLLNRLQKAGQGTQYIHQSFDGKEATGSGRSEETKKPQRNINVLNVYNNSQYLCIHSMPVDSKTNEIPVAQELIQCLDLKKNVITFDALHTQTKTCDLIASKKGIYIAPVKENQKGLLNEIKEKLERYEKDSRKKIHIIETEKRSFRFIKLPSNYDDCGFTGMKMFIEMTSYIRKNPSKMFFISNTTKLELIVEAIENRWEIENNLHKEKDTYLEEDSIHFTNKTAIHNIVILNNLAIAMAKLYGTISKHEMRIAKKEFKAFPILCINKIQEIMNNEEIVKKLIKELKTRCV